MGLRIGKSVKIGRARLNLSRSGIGVSTGIKGLRVGVNSQGKAYVSAGAHGVYYRKTLGASADSSKTMGVNNYSTYKPSSNSDTTILLVVLGFIFLFVGLIWHWLLAIPIICVSLLIYNGIIGILNNKKIEYYTKEIDHAIAKNDQEAITKLIDEIAALKIDHEATYGILKNAYKYFIEQVLEDNVISRTEGKTLRKYEAVLSSVELNELNNEIIDNIMSEIISDSIVTNEEENYITSILSNLSVSDEKKREIQSKVSECKKLSSLQTEGLKPVQANIGLEENAVCYYSGPITMIKRRKNKGEYYFEPDIPGVLYLTNDMLHIVTDGHKKIKLKDILSIETKESIIEIVVLNRQTAFFFKSNESLYVLAVVGKIRGGAEEA